MTVLNTESEFKIDKNDGEKIINKYRGIKKSYLDVQGSCLIGRPEIKDLPGREQLLELLIRYSLNDLDQKVAKNLQSYFSKLLSLLNVLKDNQSSIEDTSEATLRAYKILIDIKNSQEKDLDEFDYDQDFQYEFDEEDFDQIVECIFEGFGVDFGSNFGGLWDPESDETRKGQLYEKLHRA